MADQTINSNIENKEEISKNELNEGVKQSSEEENEKYKIKIIKEQVDNIDDDLIFKVIICGDVAVGKTSIAIRATQDLFQEEHKTTIGFDVFSYIVDINKSLLKLQIWDTCGLEEFSSCTPSLFKNASLALIVYSIDRKETFDNVNRWVNLIKKNAKPDTIFFLVGNKADLNDKRQVSKEEGEKMKESEKYGYFIETSARDGINIQNLFYKGCILLYEQYLESKKSGNMNREDFHKRNSIKITKNKNIENKKCC